MPNGLYTFNFSNAALADYSGSGPSFTPFIPRRSAVDNAATNPFRFDPQFIKTDIDIPPYTIPIPGSIPGIGHLPDSYELEQGIEKAGNIWDSLDFGLMLREILIGVLAILLIGLGIWGMVKP